MPSDRWTQPPDDDAAGWIAELRRRAHDLAEQLTIRDAQILALRKALDRKDHELAQIVSHTVIAVALLGAYAITLVTGNDSTPILTALIAYLGGAGVQKAASGRKTG